MSLNSCPSINSPQWKELVARIGVFEAMREFVRNGGEIPNASKYPETFQGVNSTMKIVAALQKTPRTSYPSNQIQGFYNDLIKYGAPSNQIELLKDHIQRNNIKEINTNELIVSLLAEMGYTVEINTAKEKVNYYVEEYNYGKKYRVMNSGGTQVGAYDTEEEASKKLNDYYHTNTSHYSNLTVPGGTNYTENELRTPAIIPSIKGHAAFSTENGIGWFRSDDQVIGGRQLNKYDKNIETPDDLADLEPDEVHKVTVGGVKTKTRRILEVQSDLFQKGRDKTWLTGETFIAEDGAEGNTWDNVLPNQFLQLLNKDNNWVGLFVQSIIQDSARKGYERVLFPSGDTAAKVEGHEIVETFIKRKQERITQLESKLKNESFLDEPIRYEDDTPFEEERNPSKRESYEREILQLNKEVADAKAGKLKIAAVANFYENTIANILKKRGYSPTIITDEYGNKWSEIVLKNEHKDTIYFQKEGAVEGQSKASPKTIAKMKQWLEKSGISIEQMYTDITQLSSAAYGNAQGVAIILNKIIKIAEGKEAEALTEEGMHFLTAMIKQGNRELYNKMMNRAGSSTMYSKVVKAYGQDERYLDDKGNLNVIKLKEETIGKILAEYYINGEEQEEAGFLARVKSWWQSILDWINSLVSKNGNPFEEVIKQMDTIDPNVLEPEKIKELATQIKDSLEGKGVKEMIDLKYSEGNYMEIVQFISDQLADPATNTNILESLGYNDKLTDSILELRGEYAQLQEEANPFKKIEDKNKEYNLVKHEETNDVDDELKGSYYTITVDGKNQVIDRVTDNAKRINAKKGKRDYLAEATKEQLDQWQKIAMQGTAGHSDLENIVNQSLNDDGTVKTPEEARASLTLKNATNKAIYNKFVDFLLGADGKEGFLYTFPIGTKFKTEIRVLDPNAKSRIENKKGDLVDVQGRAGTIDLMAIDVDGNVRIYDWKFMGFLLDKPDQNFLKRSQHALQLGEYKRILSTLGYKNINGFTVPIHAEYKYYLDKDTQEKIPILSDVVMGSTRMKDEERTPLLSVVPEGQSTGNEEVDVLVRRLTAKYNRIYKKPVNEDEWDNKTATLNQLSAAIRNLQVALNFEPLAVEAINFTNSVTSVLDKYKDVDFATLSPAQKEAAIEDLQNSLATTDYYASIDEAFISQYGTSNLSEKQKGVLDSLRETSAISKEKGKELVKTLVKLVESIAKTESISNYIITQREATGLVNSYTESASVPNKSLQLATKIVVKERSRDALEIAKEADKFKALYLAASKEAGGKNVFDIIADKTTHQLIPIIDKKFYAGIKDAKRKKDVKFLKENIDYDAYKTLLKEALERKYRDIDDNLYSTDDRENRVRRDKEKIRAQRQLDFTRSDFFGWNDRYFASLVRKTQKDTDHTTKEYKALSPAMRALHTYFVELNQRAKQMGYLSQQHSKLFLPFITGSMIQRLSQNSGKLSSLWNSAKDQFLVQDIDKIPYGNINEETGELERNVPIYFTTNNKDIADYTTDLLNMATRYIQALQEFETSKSLENTMLAIHTVEKNKGHLQTERGRVIFEGDKPKVFEGNEKNAAMVQKYIDDAVYGRSEETNTLVDVALNSTIKSGTEEEKADKKLSIKKTIQFGNLMTQQLAVGFKALVAIPNYAGAHLQAIINAGSYFKAGEYMKQHGRVVTSSLSSVEKACIHLLIPLNENIGLEKRREIARKESIGKWIGTWTFNDAMMATNRIPDKAHELTNALVWMQNTMVGDNGQLVNIKKYYQAKIADRYGKSHEELRAIEADMASQIKEAKEKLAITKIGKFDDEGNFTIPGLNSNTHTLGQYRAQVIEYGRKITGQMSRENKADYRRNIIARSFMMFKNWIPKQVSLRALDIHKDPILDDWEYGRTRLFFKTWAHLGWQNILKIRHLTSASPEGIRIMREMLDDKKSDYYKKTGEHLEITDAEFFDMMRKELKSAYKELALLVGILGLVLAAKLATPPDDEDALTNNRYKQFLRAVNKISDELYFYWSPLSAQAITRGTVLPSLGILSKIVQLGEHMGTEVFAVDWKKGELFSSDVRDKNQVIKYFLNLTPIASQLSGEVLPIVDSELATDLGYKISTASRPNQ